MQVRVSKKKLTTLLYCAKLLGYHLSGDTSKSAIADCARIGRQADGELPTARDINDALDTIRAQLPDIKI
jgi:hypothetical protein